jgi:hypothetical protein
MINNFEILKPKEGRRISELQNESKTMEYDSLRRTIVWMVVDSIFKCNIVVIQNIYTYKLIAEKEEISIFEKIVMVSSDGRQTPEGESIETF